MSVHPGGRAGSRRHFEEELRASEARFRNIIGKSADGVVVVCTDGTICYVNPSAEALLGRPAADLYGEPFGVPVVPGERTEVDVIRGGEETRVAEMRVVETEWDGRPAYLAALRDMTDRKRAEEALGFLAEAGRVLADSLDQPTTLASVARLAVSYLADWCLIDLVQDGGTVQRVALAHTDPAKEEQARPLLGRSAPTDGGEGLPAVLRSGQGAAYAEVNDALLRTLAADPGDWRLIGELGCRSAMLVPLVARGRTVGAISLMAAGSGRRYGQRDLAIAEELARRAALAVDNARLYDEAQEAVRRRDEFLAMLAHELRNPLAPILSAAQVLRARGPQAPPGKTLEVIERQGRHLARLLDDLLDISRITRGKIDIRKEPILLATALNDAVQASTPLIQGRGHTLTVAIPPEPIGLEADPTRLEQIVANLLNNAAKYTDPGGHIWLTAARDGEEAVIRVRDTGVGIAPDMLHRVFDPFVQADDTLARSQGGLGIGLTLVRGLVGLHGGTVTCQSEGLGRGSEFVVRLPLGEAPAAADVLPGGAPPGGAARVVLVEDGADAREMLRDLLELWGHSVATAEDGVRGAELIRAARPDVALVDIGLPGLDGYGVARQVRADPACAGVLLVALTGYGQPQDRRRVTEAGFDAHLIKPVNLDDLARLLATRAPAP